MCRGRRMADSKYHGDGMVGQIGIDFIESRSRTVYFATIMLAKLGAIKLFLSSKEQRQASQRLDCKAMSGGCKPQFL